MLGSKPGAFPFVKGGVLENRYQGAGGYGDPLERSPELVVHDIIDGKIGVEWAKRSYGVVVDPETMQLDEKETQMERDKILEQRLKMGQEVPEVPQTDDAKAVKLMPMGEYMEVIEVDGQKLIRCRCEYQFGPASQNWKDNASMAILTDEAVGPLVKLHEDIEMRQYVCPKCGLQLEIELLRKGDSPLFDIELKL